MVDAQDSAVEVARRPNRARWITLGVLVLVVALVALLASNPVSDEQAADPVVGGPAPTVQGEALDGRQVDVGSLQGQWVVVNFFATWCGPCREEHPELIEFDEQHSQEGSPEVVAIGFDRNDIAATRSFFAQNGGDWPVVPDVDGQISVSFGVRGLPETFLVSPEGTVVERITGAVTSERLNAVIENNA